MKIEEYQDKLKLLKSEYKTKRNDLMKEFAFSNNEICVGDVIENGYIRILVDRIILDDDFESYPYCVYIGLKVTKDLKIYKRKERGIIQQSCFVKIIKKWTEKNGDQKRNEKKKESSKKKDAEK
jgi:hypothetical protein